MGFKVKLDEVKDVKIFNSLVSNMESDVFLKSGRYIVDGKSIMGIFSLALDKPIDVEVVEKSKNELDSFVYELNKLGLIYDDKCGVNH